MWNCRKCGRTSSDCPDICPICGGMEFEIFLSKEEKERDYKKYLYKKKQLDKIEMRKKIYVEKTGMKIADKKSKIEWE